MLAEKVDEKKILERRLNVLTKIYKEVSGKDVSEKFIDFVRTNDTPIAEKIKTINLLIEDVNELNHLQKYLATRLELDV